MTSMVLSLAVYKRKTQHLVLVGDPDQLPSVGWGNVLADIIASGVIPVRKLNTIYRQGKGNPIITNSGKMQAGDVDLEWGDTFKRYHHGDDQQNMEAACELFRRCVKQFGIKDVCMLSPYANPGKAISTACLNKRLQENLNPANGRPQISYGKEKYFRVGDRVMQLVNTESASNGDVGTVTWIAQKAGQDEVCLRVKFDNGTQIEYVRENITQLDLAYAISIHKSQGSQYKTVIVVLPNDTSPFLRLNLLYTAITRSSKNIAIISPTSTISYCIRNNKKDTRYTSLAARLQARMAGQEAA